ncbi:MAG: biotin--[acetyl-CoA-carboxylase] ligase [Phycisphaeraceae bacterium]
MRSIHHDSLDSTNDEARRLLSRYPGEALRVTAGRQTAGRGRHGRTWHAPRGGVWLSLAWPTTHEPTWYEAAPLVAAWAAWRAVMTCIEKAGGSRLRIKWPNDLLLDGRKVAGILCEHAFEHTALIIGVGINANLAADALPTNLRQPATTLRDVIGRAVDLPALTESLTHALTAELTALDQHGFTDHTRLAIEEHLAFRGRPVSLHAGGHATPCPPGIIEGIAPNGGLTLNIAGQLETCTLGEVQQASTP